MNELINTIKKHGVLGILTAWLWYTHMEVQDLKVRLYDCFEDNVQMKQGSVKNQIKGTRYFAVIPKDEINDKVKKLRG